MGFLSFAGAVAHANWVRGNSGALLVIHDNHRLVKSWQGEYLGDRHTEMALIDAARDFSDAHGLDAEGTRVYLFSYYSPCTRCTPELEAIARAGPGITFKLGFSRYYVAADRPDAWPSEAQAQAGIARLTAVGWVVRKFDAPALAANRDDGAIEAAARIVELINGLQTPPLPKKPANTVRF
jgi:hypothetical protein